MVIPIQRAMFVKSCGRQKMFVSVLLTGLPCQFVVIAVEQFEKGLAIMPRTIRKDLILKARSALRELDNMDEYLFEMSQMHQGRQQAIDKMAPILLEGHEQLRKLWTALLNQL